MLRDLFALALIAIGIGLFCKGFLLVRKIPTDKNNIKPPVDASFKKVIILLFDAVRFDMVLPDSEASQSWRNHLNIFYEMHSKSPEDSLLLRFKADPPTATTQRLAGLTAGNLPTFIEVGENFSGNVSPQDNWVYQLIHSGKRMHILGDDTWLHMYPFLKEQNNATVKGYHSFHLFDLETVDNAIEQDLHPILEKKDYEVIVAHYLGMDHCGHKFGPSHSLCAQKLAQYNGIVKRVISQLSNDTLLVAMSDHGMTDDGDHGGVSPKETSAFLFLHSPTKFVSSNKVLADFREKYVDAKDLDFFENRSDIKTVEQVDFCPTISLLLGLPIPFGNLGKLIPEVFSSYSAEQMTEALKYNLNQMYTFLKSMKDIQVQTNSVVGVLEMYKETCRILKIARGLWSQFNYTLMLSGLFLAFLGVSVLVFSSNLFLTAISVGYAILLSTTSFIIFEEWVVRFSLTAILLFTFLMTKGKVDWKEFLAYSVVIRASYLFGQCREEQFPFCKVISHRSYESSTLVVLAITLSIIALDSKKARKPRDLARPVLLMALWTWNWVKDHNSIRLNTTMDEFMTLWYPRLLMIFFSTTFDLTGFLGVFQRPFSGMFLLFGSSLIPKNENAIFGILNAMLWFFATGHQATVTGIQWEAAFVGHKSSYQPLQILFLLANTFPGHLLTVFANSNPQFIKSCVVFHSICLLGMGFFCMLLIRHLMIWKVFGPRFLFQVMQFIFYALSYLVHCSKINFGRRIK